MGNCLGDPGPMDPILLPEGQQLAIGGNQPLIHEPVEWTSEVPLTEGQLRGKRDTFWETAPTYDGRPEIWDALKAAAEAAEEDDYDLAQAILNGANVSLPTGQLTDVYDELGNRYAIPKYCLSRPSNMGDRLAGGAGDRLEPEPEPESYGAEQRPPQRQPNSAHKAGGTPLTVKVRLSTRSKDVKVAMLSTDRVRNLQRKLENDYSIAPPQRIKMLYSGRVLNASTLIKDLEIPKGFVIQAIVHV